MSTQLPVVGIIGAGKLSIALARQLVSAGAQVHVSSTRDPDELQWILDVLVPQALAATTAQVIERSDVIVLALPLSKVAGLPAQSLRGKVVVDATNHWVAVDGECAQLTAFEGTSSEFVQSLLPGAIVVKALNHVGYHDIEDLAQPAETRPTEIQPAEIQPDEIQPAEALSRIGVAVAGNDQVAVDLVSQVVDAIGFTPVYAGELSQSGVLDSGNALFGAALPAPELQAQLAGYAPLV